MAVHPVCFCEEEREEGRKREARGEEVCQDTREQQPTSVRGTKRAQVTMIVLFIVLFQKQTELERKSERTRERDSERERATERERKEEQEGEGEGE